MKYFILILNNGMLSGTIFFMMIRSSDIHKSRIFRISNFDTLYIFKKKTIKKREERAGNYSIDATIKA